MSIDTAQLAQLLYGDPAPQGEAGTGVPMQNEMAPNAAPDPILAEVGSMVAQPAGNFRPKTVEFDAFGNQSAAPLALPPGIARREVVSKTSDAGYSPEKMAQIEAGPMGSKQMGKKKLNAEQKVRGDYADETSELKSAYGASAVATGALANVESERIIAEADGYRRMGSLQQQHADAMKALSVDAALAAQKAKDEYRAKLLAIPELNPNALWDEAGAPGQFQIGVAAVIHNMLGVKGLKTSAMDTINQAIKNKIDAQIYNINSKKEVAAGFKDLYNMTVAESATQMEVQAKLHGYYLKAMETGIKGEMGKYDSAVHRAKGQLALTEIRKEMAKNMFEVEKQIQHGIDQAYQREIEIRRQNMSAATAKADRESREKIAEAQAKASAKAKPRMYVFDGETGKGVLRVRDGVPEKIAGDAFEKAAKFYAADKEMLKLRELERKLDPQFDGFVGTRFSKEDARIYDATTKRLAHSMLAAMGERATDKDVKEFLSSLPMPTDLTRGGVSRVLADTHNHMHNELDGLMLQTMEDVPVEEQPDGPKNKLFGASGADAAAGTSGPADPTRNEGLVKRAKAPDALEPVKPVTIDRKAEYDEFTKPYWEDFIKQRPDMSGAKMKKTGSRDNGNSYEQIPGGGAPKAFDVMRELAEDAYHGNPKARADLEAFTTVDTLDSGSGRNAVELKVMAKYFLEKLDGAKGPLGIETEDDPEEESTAAEPSTTSTNTPSPRFRR